MYGISDKNVKKIIHFLLTQYNKYKGLCEPKLIKHTDTLQVYFRPATVCGYSPRQRLDLSVNILQICN